MSIEDNFADQIWQLTLFTFALTAAVLTGMTTAFATERYWRAAITLVGVTLMSGVILGLPEAYGHVQRRGAINGPILMGWLRMAQEAALRILEQIPFAIRAAASVLWNCLALRASGCKLLRPRTSQAVGVSPDAMIIEPVTTSTL